MYINLHITVTASNTEVIQAICAVIVAIIASVALFSWRSQKRFEAVVELLVNSHKAKEYIDLLRDRSAGYKDYSNAIEFHKGLNLKEIENTYERRISEYKLVLRAKEPRLSQLYNSVLDMKTKAWVLFGINNKFYKFYEEIINISDRVYSTHMAMVFTLERLAKGGLNAEDQKICEDQENTFHYRIYREKIDDPIVKKVDEMIAKLEEERPTFFWSDYEDYNYTNY